MGAGDPDDRGETPELADTAPPVGPSGDEAGAQITTEQPGRYDRRAELGRGGQSVVTRAWDNQLAREVAIKELRPAGPPTAEERFLREARIAARLEHPNIVPVYEIGRRADGVLYCVQRLVHSDTRDGQPRTLRRALSEAKDLDARLRLLPAFVGVCQGLAYAHAQGVLHRDVKPENVVLGRFGETVILDWGLARAAADPVRPAVSGDGAALTTVGGVAYGTPSYMSPEQARGETLSLDARADLWSLGAVLFEILTGRPPFIGATAQQIIEQVLTARVPEVLALEPHAPPELVAVAQRALERDLTRRFDSAQTIADELTAWQNGRRVAAYDYSVFELIRLFLTRHRAASTVAIAALLAIGLLATITWRRYVAARVAISHALVERAREADRALQWDRAALLYAAARVQDDNPETQWGGRISGGRTVAAPVRLTGHGPGVKRIRYSPDGASVATAGIDGKVRVFRASDGAPIAAFDAHAAAVTSLDWSADGHHLATSGEDGRALLFETKGFTQVAELGRGAHPINRVALSADGRWAALGTEDGRLELLERATSKRTVVQLPAHPVYGLALHPTLPQLALVTWDGRLELRGLDGAPLATFKSLAIGLLDVAWSPDGRWLAAAGRDKLVRLWPVNAAGLIDLGETRLLEGHQRKVTEVAFSADSTLLASASPDRSVRMWRVADARALTAQSIGSTDELHAVAFSPVGNAFAIGGAGATVDLHPRTRGFALSGLTQSEVTPVRRESLSSAPGAPWLVAHDDTGLLVIDLHTLEPRRPPPGVHSRVFEVSLSRAGTQVAWACAWDEVCEADVPELTNVQRRKLPLIPELIGADRNRLQSVALGGGWMAAGDRMGALRLWPAGSDAPLRLVGHTNTVFSIDSSPDGTRLATGSYDKSIRIWDAATGKELTVLLGHTHGIRRVRFSPDGQTIASASWDGTVRLWDVRTGRQSALCAGHEDHVFGVDWAPDGSWLASGGRDGTVRLWDSNCRPLAQMLADEGQVYGLAVWGNGRGLSYSGHSVHHFAFEALFSPQAQLEKIEGETGLRVEGLEVVPAPRR